MLIFSLHLCLPFFMLFLTLLCTYKPCRESHRQKPTGARKATLLWRKQVVMGMLMRKFT